MANQTKGTEEFFLKIFRYSILALMGLALIAIPLLLAFGAVNFMSKPKEPEPAKTAPAKEVTMDGMVQYLQELQKRQDESEKFDPSKKRATEQDQTMYLVDAAKIMECSQQFAVAVGALIESSRDSKATTEEAVRTRELIESSANRPGRGGPYVSSLVGFLCKALIDPAVITFKKADKFKGSIVRAVFNYHQLAWDRNVAEKNKFDTDEQARVAGVRAAESARIVADRALAVAALTGAGSAFAIFMMLAIYLILAKIETNLRDVNESIRAHGEQA